MLHRAILRRVAQAVDSCQPFIDLANKLINLAEFAYGRREMDRLEQTSLVLMNLPVVGARQIGLYYHGLTLKRKGKIEEAQSLLESVADNAPSTYRARAIQSLGAIQYSFGKPGEALRYYLDSLRAASDQDNRDLLTTLYAYFEISHLQSDDGDHRGALATLEKIFPLVRIASSQNPSYFYNYWANTAFELGRIGRIDEAESALSIALACPFALDYPEWLETRDDLAEKRSSQTASAAAGDPVACASPEKQPGRLPKPARALARPWLALAGVTRVNTQITVVTLASISYFPIPQTILDRLGRAFIPRGPPTCS
jgi:tetratricopeptide (TPR) repeat protein